MSRSVLVNTELSGDEDSGRVVVAIDTSQVELRPKGLGQPRPSDGDLPHR